MTSRRTTHAATLAGSQESKRASAMILEVLSGTKTTIDASRGLGVTPARYYQLEARALQGMLHALEPKRRGRQDDPARELDVLRRDNERLRRDTTRLQALLRASQRAIGITMLPKSEKSTLGGKRRRRPTARALRAVSALRTGPEGTAPAVEPKAEGKGPAAGA